MIFSSHRFLRVTQNPTRIHTLRGSSYQGNPIGDPALALTMFGDQSVYGRGDPCGRPAG